MQDSSPFQYIAIDQIFESKTNPRQTFDQVKLEELAASIKHHGLIQPIVVRPKENGFEVVAGARRYRTSLLAEEFSVPAHIKELNDAEAVEWQLVENSQRVDIHPYEEAQGFQRLLDVPGYDVAALVEKSGKSTSHIYARLSLLQLIPKVAEAFVEERITASHANLIARLPQEHQADAFENCWRKDWQDKEAHLLPAKHLSAWIQSNLYLNLAEAPFDREDTTLKPEAGACVACPRGSGFNTSLFADVQGDQCLDGACFQAKVTAHIDREVAARPELVQIETAWRSSKEQRPGTLNKNQYRELAEPDNPDTEPPCPSAKAAIIVFGKNVGRTVTVCLDAECPVHTNQAHHTEEEDVEPPPVMAEAPEQETEEEAAQRKAEHEQRMAEYKAEQQRKEDERKAEFERQQKEYEAEQARREKLRKARAATFERIVETAPTSFSQEQLRLFLRLIVENMAYQLHEEVAHHFASGEEDTEQGDDEVVLAALANTADDKLISFALRLVLADNLEIPREGQNDTLSEAEALFAPKPAKPKKTPSSPSSLVKASAMKSVKVKKSAESQRAA
ncbi:ParB/RepB/Spo0J family partition protein [Granulicella tundricola]|uniref:ParB-like partition protein n=1 Tax=Granulicella tundricola (strain ATCC BAA-1859 / DSM 23138 / MP5ACTX9) TaxID=1198114 RepID=E8X0U7_GRATM|nr:ParB/RepB/Spo0J family partition protein [Granulicella tundricola]ADW70131.1 parB-like partition protein [Granulicella tundricola MP5ACTX9]